MTHSTLLTVRSFVLTLAAVLLTSNTLPAEEVEFDTIKSLASRLIKNDSIAMQKPEVSHSSGKWSLTPADIRQTRSNPITPLEYIFEQQLLLESYRQYLYKDEGKREILEPFLQQCETELTTMLSSLEHPPFGDPANVTDMRKRCRSFTETLVDGINLAENLDQDTPQAGLVSSIRLADPAKVRNARGVVEFVPLTEHLLRKELKLPYSSYRWTRLNNQNIRLTGAFLFRTYSSPSSAKYTMVKLTESDRTIDFGSR